MLVPQTSERAHSTVYHFANVVEGRSNRRAKVHSVVTYVRIGITRLYVGMMAPTTDKLNRCLWETRCGKSREWETFCR